MPFEDGSLGYSLHESPSLQGGQGDVDRGTAKIEVHNVTETHSQGSGHPSKDSPLRTGTGNDLTDDFPYPLEAFLVGLDHPCGILRRFAGDEVDIGEPSLEEAIQIRRRKGSLYRELFPRFRFRGQSPPGQASG